MSLIEQTDGGLLDNFRIQSINFQFVSNILLRSSKTFLNDLQPNPIFCRYVFYIKFEVTWSWHLRPDWPGVCHKNKFVIMRFIQAGDI